MSYFSQNLAGCLLERPHVYIEPSTFIRLIFVEGLVIVRHCEDSTVRKTYNAYSLDEIPKKKSCKQRHN